MTFPLLRFVALVSLLAIVAATAEPPTSTDRDVYERIGRTGVALDCGDVHCFRPLVALVVEHLPGPSLLKWRAYAVVTIAGAALALARLCLVMGLSTRAAGFAVWIAAFGYGPLQSIFDPYTSDPVMYLIGPLMMADLLSDRYVRAGAIGCIAVFAKEFAAVPLWIFAVSSALQRRWELTVRALAGASTATLVWLTLQTVLMTLYNYSYGQNASVDLLGGGYFRVWTGALGPRLAAAYLFMAFGPLYILLAVGWLRSERALRLLALACIPAVLAFAYVQQPDRALWNFHFVVVPLAVTILAQLPDGLCWLFIVCFGVANLRLGSPQPDFFPILRGVMLTISSTVAVIAAVRAVRPHHDAQPAA